ncbi:MAG: glucose-6-phosphate dehydrogenase [Actinomycetota bacterium]
MGPPVHPEADALILFGASGDLARKKLLPALYELTRHGRLHLPVIGVANTDWFNHDFAERAREAVGDHVGDPERIDTDALDDLCERLSFVSGDYADPSTWRQLAAATEDTKLAVAFLAVPPDLVDAVVKGIDAIYLASRCRVVVEKPFGRDLASAKELNHTLHRYLDESQLFRIDHFLGKEPVQNLMVFRFANSLLEAVWNRNHVESVTVTMAESFGVEGRGAFYDGVGCIRDVVQNHLLQMVALLTMEPPASKNQHALLDEKVKVFRAMRPLDPADVVRGQVEGYRTEPGVDPDSDTETFAAMKLEIDSWRWSGVPFYIRAGKSLATTVTEAVVEFKQPPRMLFSEEDHVPDPCRLRFRMKPDDSITLSMQSKVPGVEMVSQSVDMTVDYDEQTANAGNEPGHVPDAYERLIGDAIIGDHRLFTRQDGVEETWRVVDPILRDMEPTKLYRAGSWGPDEARRLVPPGCGDV